MKIIAIVPAYNCERTIQKVIEDLNNHFVDKILIIDDGSHDQTAKKVRETGTEVISYRKNKGLGYALRLGFREALKRDFGLVLTFDGDGQHLASDIRKVKKTFDKNPDADIVIGTRIKDRKHWSKFPFHRLWGNLVLTGLTNFGCGKIFTSDSQSGYRAIKREALKKMQLQSDRMAISSEIILDAYQKNLKLVEVSILPTYGDEVSNQKLLLDTWIIINLILRRAVLKK